MKKLLLTIALLVSVIALFFTLGTTASAETYGDLTYEISDGEITITDCDTSVTTVEIPSEIDGYTVTIIDDQAFYGCSSLTSVTVPDSVTSIGYGAFRGCKSLETMTLPFVGSSASASGTEDAVFGYIFGYTKLHSSYGTTLQEYSDSGYKYYYIPSSLRTVEITAATQIPYGSFYGCAMLTSITINGPVTTIGKHAFHGCSNLSSVIMPDSISIIDDCAFYYCRNLTSIRIPQSITNFGYSVFYDCYNLSTVNIADISAWCETNFSNEDANPISYAKKFYINNELITKLSIPNNVTSIGKYAFYNCSELIDITIPDTVTTIGEYAFLDCTNLTSIIVPDSLENIGVAAFKGCNSLEYIKIPFIGANLSARNENSVFGYIFGYKSLKSSSTSQPSKTIFQYYSMGYNYYYYIPESLKTVDVTLATRIPYNAFYNCSMLTSITIPNTVETIGISAFENCHNLTSVIIPDSVISIGDSAFKACSSLNSIIVPDSVTSIGDSSFKYCSSLNYIKLPFLGAKITATGYDSVFGYIFGWTTSNFSDTTHQYTDTSSSPIIYKYYYYIPQALRTVEISNMTSIPDMAFYNCSMLTNIIISNSVAIIGEKAFCNCYGLAAITIPDSVTTIGAYAFGNCTGLTSVTIPDSVTTIGDYTFENCISLAEINVDSDNEDFASIDGVLFSKTLRRLVQYPAGKTEIIYAIPDRVYRFAPGAFSGCQHLEEVVINKNITIIDNDVFRNCVVLKTITIPEQITNIGSSAFSGCTGLTKINWNAKNVSDFTSSSDVFYNAGTSGDGIDVVFGDNVEKIPKYLFYVYLSSYSPKITSVTIGNSVTTIGSDAFYGCKGLTKINWNAKKISSIPSYNYIFQNAGKNSENGGIEVVFGDGVTTIPSYIFYGASVKSVEMPNTVTKIGDYAFYNCTPITEITIPDSVSSIGSYAFANCTSIKTLSVPENVSTIGNAAFDNCSSMKHIYLYNPNCLTTDNVKNMIYQDTVIHSHSGYSVEAFANKYGYDFMELHTISDEWTSNATCGQAGQKYHPCKYCDEKFDIEAAPATGKHNYTSAVTTVATCKSTGVRTYTCAVCKDTYTETIAKDNKNHAGGTEIRNKKSATCTSEGHTGDTYCVGCNTKIANGSVIAATGHDYKTKIIAPTCTEKGYTIYSCACGFSNRLDYVSATGHTAGEWKVVLEAQIGAEGKEVQKCIVCGEVVAERVIPAIPEVTYTVGDANGDGKVNAIDARIILRVSAQIEKIENYNVPLAVFDLTGDGKVNAIDARKALRIGAQLE